MCVRSVNNTWDSYSQNQDCIPIGMTCEVKITRRKWRWEPGPSLSTPIMSVPLTPQFNWGVSGVSVPVPPSRNAIPVTVPPLSDLRFHPVDEYNVRRNLGVAMAGFRQHRDRFSASNIAFLAAGASKDGRHNISPDDFFPEFLQLHESQPSGRPGQLARKDWGDRVRRLIFDLVCYMHTLLHLYFD
jgi:hypothetical protein